MRALIEKSHISGSVSAPPSKSYTLRALMCAALADGQSEIRHPLGSDDTEAALDILSKIGINIQQTPERWLVSGGRFREANDELYCRESAVTQRFMTAICSLIPGECRLRAALSLADRPLTPLIKALQKLGVDCHYKEGDTMVNVHSSRLEGGSTELPGDISSQYVSALLLVTPFADKGVHISLTTPLESKPYVLMTLECLRTFGIEITHSDDLMEYKINKQKYQPAVYTVEGDWSSASYPLALGATAGDVTVSDVNIASLQGDRIIVDFLKDMGASVTIGRDSVTVKRSALKALRADFTDCTDLLPTMAVVAAMADGISVFTGIDRARLKESDRVAALREGLENMGIEVKEENNRLIITGAIPKGGVVKSHNDHRIAMAFSLIGIVAGNTIINGAECVAKTYPEFWDILESIGGRVRLDEE